MNLELNNIVLSSYDDNNYNHKRVLLDFLNDSKSKYIHDIEVRLKKDINDKNIFDRGYLVEVNNLIVGYVFISKIIKDEIFLEYSVIKKYRGKKIGKLILNEVSDYLISNYNLKSIILDIDPSNISSVMIAVNCGYLVDDEDYIKRNMDGKILYRMDNYDYVNKRKK